MTDPVKEVLAEYSECETFSRWLKEHKGINMTPEECCKMFGYFKDYRHWADMVVPQRMALFDCARNIVTHWNGCMDQMNQLFELYYTIKHGINGLEDRLEL